MCNLGKKRVRDAARWPSNDARRARAAAARAALPPREGSRRASKHGVRDALEGVVESYACNEAAAHALEELQRDGLEVVSVMTDGRMRAKTP